MTAPDIFLSYNREDLAVTRIYAAALTAGGFSVWWDQTLKSGDTYDEVTEGALRSAKAVVVLWTPRSVASRWVRAEATLGQRQNTLLPVMVEPCERPVMFELTQTADMIGWQGNADDPAWCALVEDIRRFADKPVPETVEQSVPAMPALALPKKPSVAVLPFASIGGGEDDDYFADGMAVEIVSALSRFQSLFVISSGSTLSYRGDSRGPTEIARELGVRYILQGNVRKAGKQVRIAVELLDEVTLAPIWTNRFDGSLDDIFELQDSVSHAVASQIEPSITASEVRRAALKPSPSNNVYDLYLRGIKAYWDVWTKDTLALAADRFERAAALDPEFALAQAYASSALINSVLQGFGDDPAPLLKKSADYARAALRVGQDDAEVLALAAYTLFQCDEPQTNIDDIMARAFELNSGMSRVHYTAGFVSLYACRSAAAVDAYDMALRLDPRTPWRDAIMIGKAQALFQLGQYAEALPILIHEEPAFPQIGSAIRRIIAICHARMGNIEAARAVPGVLEPLNPYEEFLISRYRDPVCRQGLYDGMTLLIESASA
jgi:TolB-like protein